MLMQLSPYVKYDILGNHLFDDHIWSAALLLDQVWVSCRPRGGRNNNNCGFNGIYEYRRTKSINFC